MSLSKSRFIEMFDLYKEKKLSEVAEIIMGQSPDSNSYNNTEMGLPFYQGKTEFSDKYIGSPVTWCSSPCRIAEKNDILMSVRAPVGDVNIATEKCCIGRGLASIRPLDGESTFLFYALKLKKAEIASKGNGSTFKAINKETVHSITIPDVPQELKVKFSMFAEQIDKSKFLLQKILEKLELLKKSRFIEMFDKENKEVSLKDCCEIHARIGWQALTQKEHMKSGEYVLVTGTDFVNNAINFDSCVYVKKERYEMDPHIILKENDILVTKDGTIGKVAIVKNLPKPATLNSGIFVIRPDRRFDKDYIAYVFKGPIFEHFVDSVKTGATIKHLNQNKLVEFKIPVPTLKKQEEFSLFCHHLDKSKLVIQKSLEDLVGKS